MKTKRKPCEYCGKTFTAKYNHTGAVRMYCPECSKKKVWFRKFTMGKGVVK